MLFRKKPKPTPAVAEVAFQPSKARYTKRRASSAELSSFAASSTESMALSSDIIADRTRFFQTFFTFCARVLPQVSAAVWTWKHLCSTKRTSKLVGGSDATRARAQEILTNLRERISPLPHVKSGGLDYLLDLWFSYVFKYGRFGGVIELSPLADGIERFTILDPFRVKFSKNDFKPFILADSYKPQPLPQAAFYYYGMDADVANPYGVAMLEAAYSLIKIADEMLQDMRLASSNAGVPRLHIKISQPPIAEFEDEEDYRNRISSYFQQTVSSFVDLAPDDNVYSWADVEVSTVGGGGGPGGFVWSINRNVIDEEILSAFHLFPWVVGKSSSTTKNWVQSQYDLLMSQVESIQTEAESFAHWISRTELALHGITDVQPITSFQRLRDPAFKNQAIAQRFNINNVRSKILMGIISPDDGARELGYDKAYDPELIYKKGDENDTQIPGDKGSANSFSDFVSYLNELDEKLDVLITSSESVHSSASQERHNDHN